MAPPWRADFDRSRGDGSRDRARHDFVRPNTAARGRQGGGQRRVQQGQRPGQRSPFPRSRGRYRSGRPPTTSRSRRTASSPTSPIKVRARSPCSTRPMTRSPGSSRSPRARPSSSRSRRTAGPPTSASTTRARDSVHLIAFIDTATSTVTATVPVNNDTPGPSTTSPDGRYLYVPNHNMTTAASPTGTSST